MVPLQDLALHVAVGRLCLSFLPPGWPGYHDRRELGATLAASLLLGAAALALIENPWFWAVLLLVRLAFLPGALRPRYEFGRGWGLKWLGLFVGLAVVWTYNHPNVLLPTALLGALWIVVGIETWRRRADRRARALAVCGLLAPLVVGFL
jgi:hypothetical protein